MLIASTFLAPEEQKTALLWICIAVTAYFVLSRVCFEYCEPFNNLPASLVSFLLPALTLPRVLCCVMFPLSLSLSLDIEFVPVGGYDDEAGDVEGAADMMDVEGDDDAEVFADVSAFTISSHDEPVYCVAINQTNPDIVATGAGDDMAKVFQRQENVDGIVEMKEMFTCKGHEDSVVDIAFSTNGKLLATAGYDATVKIWDVATGDLVQSLTGPADAIEWIQWHKKGSVILGGSSDATAWMWLASSGACMQVFAGHEDAISCGAFSGNGKVVVTGSVDGSAKLWNPKSGECLFTFRVHSHGWHTEGIVTLAVHPTKPLAITGGQDGTARLIQLQHHKILATFSHENATPVDGKGEIAVYGVEAVGFSPSFNWAASGSMDGKLRVWDLKNNTCRHECMHPAGVIKLTWHATLPLIITACADAKVRVWDARNGDLLKELAGHSDVILAMDAYFAADDVATIFTGSDDTNAKVFTV